MPLLNDRDRPSCAQTEAELDSRLFAHIHHDARLVGSHLQGTSLLSTTSYIKKMLEYIQSHDCGFSPKQKKEFSVAYKKLNKKLLTMIDINTGIEWTRVMLLKETDPQVVNETLEKLGKSILGIFKEEQEVLIPGGWDGGAEGRGHAMVYKLMKKTRPDGSPYTVFLVYNTGAGANYHLKRPKVEDRLIPVMAYELPDVSKLNENDLSFILGELVRPTVTPSLTQLRDKPEWVEQNSFDAQKTYANIISKVAFLGGKKIDPKPFSASTTKGQLSGTCAMRVLMPVLANELSGETFRHFLYQLRLQSIIDHFRIQGKKGNLSGEMVQTQLTDAIDKLERTTRKFRIRKHQKNPILSEAQSFESLQLKTDIEDRLRKESEREVTGQKETKKETEKGSPSQSFRLSENFVTMTTDIAEGRGKLEPYKPIPKFEGIKPDMVSKYFDEVLKSFQENDKLLYSEGIIKDFEDLMLTIPITGDAADRFWKEIPADNTGQILNKLRAIQKIYGKHCYLQGGYPFAERTLASASVVFLASRLAYKRFSEKLDIPGSYARDNLFETWPLSDYVKHTVSSLIAKDPYTVSADPRWDQRLVDLRKFYKDNLEKSQGPDSLRGKKVSEHHYDIELINRHGLNYQLSSERYVKGSVDTMDQARANLYDIANGSLEPKRDAERSRNRDYGYVRSNYKDILGDFDFCDSFSELLKEFNLFQNGDYRYFRNVDSSGYERSLEVRYHESGESRIGVNYRSGLSFARISKVPRPYPRDLSTVANLKNSIIREAIFPKQLSPVNEGLQNSNQCFLTFEDLGKKLERGAASRFPIYSAPFTRITIDTARIIATKDFLESNFERLNDRDFQMMFYFNFFSPSLITEQLIDTPEYALTLAKTLKEAFQSHIKGQELDDGGIFCIRLSYLLQKYISACPNKDKMASAVSLLNTFDEDIERAIKAYSKVAEKQKHASIEPEREFKEGKEQKEQKDQKERKIIKESSKNQEERLKALTRLKDLYDLSLLRNTLPSLDAALNPFENKPDKLKAFLLRMFSRGLIVAPRSINNDVFLESELSHRFKFAVPAINEMFLKKMSADDSEKLLREVITEVFVPRLFSNSNFKLNSKYFPSVELKLDDKIYYFDFTSGSIRGKSLFKAKSGKEVEGLFIERTAPFEFYTQDVVEYFGDLYLVGKYYPEASQPTFEFNFRGSPHRIILDQKGNAHIQMRFSFDAKWHELQGKEKVPAKSLPAHFSEMDRLWWCDTENEPPKTIYITDKLERPSVSATLQGIWGKDYLFEELTQHGQKTAYVLNDLLSDIKTAPSYLEPFLRFEDPKFISFWTLHPGTKATQQKPAIRIALPRYGMEFYSSGEGSEFELIWKENPEYRLSLKDLQAIPNFSEVIYLEHRKTKNTIAIIPNQVAVVKEKVTSEQEKMAAELKRIQEKLDEAREAESKPKTQTSWFSWLFSGWSKTIEEKKNREELLQQEIEQAKEEDSLLYEGEYYKFGLDKENAVASRALGLDADSKLWNYTRRETYFTFAMKEGELNPRTVPQCLYLAYLYLAKHKPRQAIQVLREAYKLGGLKGTEEEIDLIKKIMCEIPPSSSLADAEMHRKAKTDDPETITARLTAAWILTEFKQSSLDTPQFPMVIPTPKTFKDNNEKSKFNRSLAIRSFYTSDFQVEVKNSLNSYMAIQGNVGEELELTADQGLSLVRYALKDQGDIKTHYDQFRLSRRWRELELINLRKEEQQLDKKLKQGKLSKLGEARLQKIKAALSAPVPYYVAQYKIETANVSIDPEIPTLDYIDSKLISDPGKIYEQYKKMATGTLKEDEQYDREVLATFLPPIKASELTLKVPFRQFLTGFNAYYDLAQDTSAKSKAERDALAKFVEGMLRFQTEATSYGGLGSKSENRIAALCSLLSFVIRDPKNDWPDLKLKSQWDTYSLESLKKKCQECAESKDKKPIVFEVVRFVPDLPIEQKVTAEEKLEFNAINPYLKKDLLEVTSLGSRLNLQDFIDNYQNAKGQEKTIEEGKVIEEREGIADKKAPKIFDRKGLDEPFFQREARYFAKDLKEGQKINAKRREQYELAVNKFKNKVLRQEMLNNLESLARSQENDLHQSETLLLKRANEALTGKAAKEKTRLEIAGLTRRPLTMADLTMLYLQNDLNLFKKRTELENQDAIALYQAIHQFLLKKTEFQHTVRVKNALTAASKLKEDDPELYPQLHQIAEKLSESRCFNPEENPELLAFESCEDIMIRPTQADILKKLLKEGPEGYESLVAQLIMGGGKSKVLLPLLALKKANGTNLSIIEVPQALYETNLADLRATTQKFFGKQAHRFIFSRDSSCKPEDLKALYQKLKQHITNQEYIVTTAESVQALELKYWELLEDSPKNSADLPRWNQDLLGLEKILKLFKNQGDALIDEVDSNLNPKKELNYTIGESAAIQELELKTLLQVYNLFPETKVELSTGKATLENIMLGEVSIVNKSDWNLAFKNLSEVLTNSAQSPIYSLCKDLSEEQKLELQRYLFHDYLDELPEKERPKVQKPKFIEESKGEDLKIKIGLLKGEFEFLKYTLKRKAGENYGFPKSTKYVASKEIAIPYIANNIPNKRAQFGSFYETANYTLQLQFQKKILSLDVLKEFVADFHKRANFEVANTLGTLPFEETDASKEFFSLTGLTLSSVHPSDSLKEFRRKWSANKEIRDLCLFKYVLKEIKHYPTVLRSDAVNHASIYRSRQGFTGTPWNYRCYHPDMRFKKKESLGVDGQTFDHLIRKETVVKVATEKTPEELIRNHLEHHPKAGRVHAFIDVGALFKGKVNEDIARLLCLSFIRQKRNDIKHILYFNNKNVLCAFPVDFLNTLGATERERFLNGEVTLANFKKMKEIKVIEIGSSDPAAILEKTGSSPENCFTYYDQNHTTGTDIRQPLNSIGITTADINTDARSLAQGVMRMRDLPGTQEIEFLLSKPLAETFPTEKTLNIEQVISRTLENQWTTLSEMHFQAALQKMNDIIREDLRRRIYNAKDGAEKLNLYRAYRQVFLLKIEDDPYKQFGELESLEKTQKILETVAAQKLQKWKDCLNGSQSPQNEYTPKEEEDIRDRLLKQSRIASKNCLIERKHVPSVLENSEVFIEREKEKEKEKHPEKEKEVEEPPPAPRPEKYRPWKAIPFTEGVGESKEGKDEKETYEGYARSGRYGDSSSFFPSGSYSGGYGAGYRRSLYEEDYAKANSLNELLKGLPEETRPKFLFHEAISASINYSNTVTSSSQNLLDKKKPLNFVLYVQSPPPKTKLQAMLLTAEDAVELKSMIQKQKDSLQKAQYKVAILSTHEGPLIQLGDVTEHPDYHKLYEQICYFNADLDALSKNPGRLQWLLDNTPEKMQFLEAQLLRYYPEKTDLSNALALAFEAVSATRQLEEAIIKKEYKSLSELLERIGKISNPFIRKGILNATNRHGRGMLNLAVETRDQKLLELMFAQKDIDPQRQDHKNESPLMTALKLQDENMIQFFVQRGLLPPMTDIQSWSSILWLTTSLKNREIFKLFYNKVITSGAKPEDIRLILNTIPKGSVEPLFHTIISQGNMSEIKTLFDSPFIRSDVPDSTGAIAIECALKTKNPDIIKFFIEDKRFLPEKNDLKRWGSIVKYALETRNLERFQKFINIVDLNADPETLSTLLMTNFDTAIIANNYELMQYYMKLMSEKVNTKNLPSGFFNSSLGDKKDVESKDRFIVPRSPVKGPCAVALLNDSDQALKVLFENELTRPFVSWDRNEDLYKAMIVEAIYSKSKKAILVLNKELSNEKNMDKWVKSKMYTNASSSYYGGPQAPNVAIMDLLEKSETEEDPVKFKETLEFLENYLQIEEVIPKDDYELRRFWWGLIRNSNGKAFPILEKLLDRLPDRDRKKFLNPSESERYELVRADDPAALQYYLKINDQSHILTTVADNTKNNLLDSAAISRNPVAFRVLLEDGRLNPNTQGVGGLTPLMTLFQNTIDEKDASKLIASVDLLLKHDLDVTLKDSRGNDIFKYLSNCREGRSMWPGYGYQRPKPPPPAVLEKIDGWIKI